MIQPHPDAPTCPHCLTQMVKLFIERQDHQSWNGAWVCHCKKSDWELNRYDYQPVIYSHATPTSTGIAINELLQHKEH